MSTTEASIALLMLSSSVPIVALASCTGVPSECCGGVKTSCENIDGCTWIPATPGNYYYGSCEGVPTPCDAFSDDSLACLKQDGCSFGPNQEWSSTGAYCTGNPKSPAQCIGTAPAACSGDEERECKSVLGCTYKRGDYWFDGECVGTPTPCTDLSNNECSCNLQMGCTYYQDPPDPTEHFYDAIMPVREGYRECYGPDDMYVEVSPNEFVWTNSVVMCEKCRPTSLGRDVCYWTYSSWDPSLVFHSCVMKIGDQYCSCEICDEGGTAFNCQEALDSYGGLDDSVNTVVGRTCSGNCMWSSDTIPESPSPAPSTPEPTSPAPSTPEPTSPKPSTPEPTSPKPSTPEPTSPKPLTPEPTSPKPLTPEPTSPAPSTPEPTSPTPTTPEPTSEEHATTVPTQEASSNILTPGSTAVDGSFSESEHLVSLLIMLLWIQ